MLMFIILLLSSIKIDIGVKLAHLVNCVQNFQSIVLCVWMGFGPIGLCVLTVWASIRDPTYRDRRLLETRRLLKHEHQPPPAFIRDSAFNRSWVHNQHFQTQTKDLSFPAGLSLNLCSSIRFVFISFYFISPRAM